eukprot:CAMPEP_0205833008 /NCGR_PEP_ID=MMETSP0206-20130828/48519_1 /ASSEMBLY_ACC=CAM_ASM_000279 /TAXON_ID=36767 /ORGANISM="Euplotes focardii, Strain TN1" /LENGTH=48 /DNA_ID= /DNA_START= /DNA_END= /DNA_ORIENTATION=
MDEEAMKEDWFTEKEQNILETIQKGDLPEEIKEVMDEDEDEISRERNI